MRVKQPTVLVVEDNPEIREFIRDELDEMGLEHREAADARSAIALLTSQRPDLVCLDLVLPELSGYELCEFIRRSPALADVPILMISGRTLPEDVAVAEEAGASAYLTKPFTSEQLQSAVRALVRGGGNPGEPLQSVA
jgi:DNA-binding response OmpR family regulator